MELAFINYSGPWKYPETGNAVAPLRKLESGYQLNEPRVPDHNTWRSVVQIWLLGIWANGEELQSLVRWQHVGRGDRICVVVCVCQWMWDLRTGWPARRWGFPH